MVVRCSQQTGHPWTRSVRTVIPSDYLAATVPWSTDCSQSGPSKHRVRSNTNAPFRHTKTIRASHHDRNPSHLTQYLQTHRPRCAHSVGATRHRLGQWKTADQKSNAHPTLNPPKKSPGVRFSTFEYGPGDSRIRRSQLKSQEVASGTCVAGICTIHPRIGNLQSARQADGGLRSAPIMAWGSRSETLIVELRRLSLSAVGPSTDSHVWSRPIMKADMELSWRF